MKTTKLSAQVREVTGKGVKNLRKQGLIIGSVYGKDVKSASISMSAADFFRVYNEAGETGLVELSYGKENKHALIKRVQIHPVNRKPLHVEFYAVKLTEKIKANVPLTLVGEAPAVTEKIGTLLQTLNEVEVEALPTNLPEEIVVDATKLINVGDQITVEELNVAKDVEVLTDKGEVVVKVGALVQEEKEEVAPVATEEAGEQKTGEEGEKTAEEGKGEEGEKKEKEKE